MDKQLFYLTNDRLAVYAWSRRTPACVISFPNDENGWQDFAAHIGQSHIRSAAVLVDLIEEDFQHDTMPHVMGSARRALMQRRLAQHYRDTPYRQAHFQLREKTGRKDDRMLFSALTNIDILKPWMDVITQHRVPLAGIFSMALLSPALFKRIRLHDEHALIITHQSGALRQNYFHEGKFRLSRMTPLTNDRPETLASVALQEVAKTRQFLASTRVLPRDAPLAIVTVAHERYRAAFEEALPAAPTTAYRFIDLFAVAKLFGLSRPADTMFCEQVFMSFLASRMPPTHYPTFDAGRQFQLEKMRIALNVLSALIALGGIGWTAANAMEALNAHGDSAQYANETHAAEARYRAIIDSLPPTADNPHDMSSAVATEERIWRNAPDPRMLAVVISSALDASPQIRINQLHWEVSATSPVDDPAAEPQSGAAEAAPSGMLLGIPAPPFQLAEIEGEVTPFGQNYKTAMDRLNQFVGELRKTAQLKVDITKSPVDISPAARLEGEVGHYDPDAKAKFVLRLVWTPVP